MSSALAKSNFKASGLFLEKFIASARHVEVQIFGDGRGTVAVLGERDCSAQRRNQKVLEETPAPCLAEPVRQRLHEAARRLGQAAKYRSAGTCEFMYDAESEEFYFLEVNTRLQVEHCVTEEVSGLDLVEWMIRLASGEALPLAEYRYLPNGHAIEARVYAEDPNKNFQPSCGLLTEVWFPGRCAGGRMGRARQRSDALLRSDDRKGNRPCADSRRSDCKTSLGPRLRAS